MSPAAAYDLGHHVVWCPKYRRPVLGGRAKDRREELIRATAGEHGCQIMALDVVSDQVHLFVTPNPKSAPAYVANQFPGFTSHHPRAGFPHPRSPLPTPWSRSCFVATVGAVPAETVRRYMETRYERPEGGGRA
ncbi:IS200/IS605 family transposase [Microbispora triticiradicis]|uniref:IS200/IS605 family transposase n=2 Tax=Microbispora TaxID=2005 RepID=A0ABY3LWX8_9ACTN|nr:MULTISPECIES: IS200/IS605 family transposase [Microbispora]TLP58929.1 IS200/IS605 family transposase [Microbispora fusca]TYB57753.1 IS200/IS605 family transposase [Microbispora tritici]